MNLFKEEKKNCLTCKYEPDWKDRKTEETFSCLERIGYCKHVPFVPGLSIGYKIVPRQIALFKDHELILPSHNCKAWECK